MVRGPYQIGTRRSTIREQRRLLLSRQRRLDGCPSHGPQPVRWTKHTGLCEAVATTEILRRGFFSLAGRITRKARRFTLHLPGLVLAKPVQPRPGPIARPVLTLNAALGL